MKTYVQNRDQLLSHGDIRLRAMALKIIETALEASNPYRAAKDLVYLTGDRLRVGHLSYDLSRRGAIYVIGAGKATFQIAKALEEILGDRIKEGLVLLKKGQTEKLDRIRIVESSHPIPDASGLKGARKMMQLAARARKGDIVFACITGGSSALLPMPAHPVTLAEKKRVNRLLLSSGASILEINAVRKHLSQIKGGRLALAIFPAELINLTVSDVIADPLDYITDPTVPDTSTVGDAMRVLTKYHLLKKVPSSVLKHLKSSAPHLESPKDFGKMIYHNFVLTNNDSACQAAATTARTLHLRPMVLSTMFDGESREVGRAFAAVAKEIRRSQRPMSPPCILIGGGETVVTLNRNFGKGGPNQEFVVSTILSLGEQRRTVVVGIDTDGTDGPTDGAGAMADGCTIASAKARGVDLERALEEHKVNAALISLDDIISTGQTGTNVNDLKFVILM